MAHSLLPSRPRVATDTNNINTTTSLTATSNSGFEKNSMKHSIAPLTSDRIDRTSFSSIRESNSGIAQTFTSSQTSSYLRNEFGLHGAEEAIEDDSTSGSSTPPSVRDLSRTELPVMLNPHSRLNAFICPCDGFRGWKTISISGKTASKSFGDLRGLAMQYDWSSQNAAKVGKMNLVVTSSVKQDSGCHPAGESPFEKLPAELLGKINPPCH